MAQVRRQRAAPAPAQTAPALAADPRMAADAAASFLDSQVETVGGGRERGGLDDGGGVLVLREDGFYDGLEVGRVII